MNISGLNDINPVPFIFRLLISSLINSVFYFCTMKFVSIDQEDPTISFLSNDEPSVMC